MNSGTIRINPQTKKALDQRLEAFKKAYGIKLTLDQLIHAMLHLCPIASAKKKPKPNRKHEILVLHDQGLHSHEIAKQLGLSVRYCNEVIQYSKL